MSKHKPPRQPSTASVIASAGVAKPDNALTAVLAEKVKLRLELIARLEHQQVLELRARLAKLPPVPQPDGPTDHEPPANED